MKRFFLYWCMPLVFFLVAAGCPEVGTDDIIRDPLWPDIDLSLYQSGLPFRNIRPSTIDYWELRLIADHRVVVAVGDKCSKASNPQACVTEFDALRVDSGFGNAVCREPFYPCLEYIVSNQGDTNRIWNTLDKLKEFLGTIDSKEEALLLAEGHGFYTFWAVSISNGIVSDLIK